MTPPRSRSDMDRREFLGVAIAAGVSSVVTPSDSGATAADRGARRDDAPAAPAFEFAELTVTELQARMTKGTLTSRALTAAYLARIASVDASGPTSARSRQRQWW